MLDGTRIVAVIVSWNKLDLLKSCISAIKSGTTTPDIIMVVDNNSSDGTKEFLLELEDDHVTPILLEDNFGGCYSYTKGINEAIEENATYIWLMDEDTAPGMTCLQNQLEFLENNNSYDVASAQVLDDKGRHHKANLSVTNDKGLLSVCTFVGSLHRASLFYTHPLPNVKLFNFYDDVIFYESIFMTGVKGHFVSDATITHFSSGADAQKFIASPRNPRSALFLRNTFIYQRFKTGILKTTLKIAYYAFVKHPEAAKNEKKPIMRMLVLFIGFKSLFFRIFK